MSITRAQAEATLIRRAGKWMSLVEMDVSTKDGTNADLNDPLVDALLEMGIVPVSYALVTDADLATAGTMELLDRAELRLLESIAGNLDLVNVTIGPRREELGKIGEQVEKAIARLQKRMDERYNDGRATLDAGTIYLDFMEKDDLNL